MLLVGDISLHGIPGYITHFKTLELGIPFVVSNNDAQKFERELGKLERIS